MTHAAAICSSSYATSTSRSNINKHLAVASEVAQRLMAVEGVGPVTATAVDVGLRQSLTED